MKILIAPLHYWYEDRGGEVSWAYDFLNALDGVDVEAVAANPLEARVGSRSRVRGYSSHEYHPSAVRSLIFHTRCYFIAKKILKHSNAQVVHHFLPFSIGLTFNLLAIFGGLKGRRFVVGPIQSSYRSKPGFIYRLLFFPFKLLFEQTIKRADSLIAISEDAEADLLLAGAQPSKITVISPGIKIEDYENVRMGFFEDMRLITVGHLIDRKAVDLLILAIGKVKSRYPRVKLVVVGAGDKEEELRGLVKELDLESNIEFVGQVKKEIIRKYYAKAHAYVSMSRAETWGQVYVEAMACGLPVIAAENSGSKSILKEGHGGVLIPAGDTDALAHEVIKFIENPAQIASVGDEGREFVKREYDWATSIIPQYKRIYEGRG